MKRSLREGDALIYRLLLQQWHLVVSSIHFIPIGDSAYSYRVEVETGDSYYLKIVDRRGATGQRTAAHYAYRVQLRNLAHWLHNLLHEPLDEVQRDNDVTMIEHHCLDRLGSVERTMTELVARSTDGMITLP